MSAVVFWQVSQKQAARSAEAAKHNTSRHAGLSQPATGSLQQQQQQQQQQRPQANSKKQPSIQHAIEDEACWRPQQAQHVLQDHQAQQPSSNSLRRDDSGEDVGMAGIGRGSSPVSGAGVAAGMASDTSAAHARASFPPQAKLCHPHSPCHICSPLPSPSPFITIAQHSNTS